MCVSVATCLGLSAYAGFSQFTRALHEQQRSVLMFLHVSGCY
jgi:hypothetical protein